MIPNPTALETISDTHGCYRYDQGMMSLINTNQDYLSTMGISEEDPQVGVIVSVYYLGCALGAVLFSWAADRYGRKTGLFACLATAALGNLIMFLAGLGYSKGALTVMYIGRMVMGFGKQASNRTRTASSPSLTPSLLQASEAWIL
jgi:MFS family permease